MWGYACRFTCDTSLTDKAVPYMPAEDGSPWPRLTTSGCSGCAAAAGAAEEEAALRAQLAQHEEELQALRAEIAALTDTTLDRDGGGGSGGEEGG